MVQRLEQLLVAGEAPGVVHDHGLPHGQRQQQHGHDGGRHAGPAQAHVVGVGLVAGGKAAAGMGGEQHRAHGERGQERGLWNLGFHSGFLLQKLMMVLAGQQKIPSPLLPLGRRDERMKTFRGTTLLCPRKGNTLTGIPSYPRPVTGAPVRACSCSARLLVQPVRRVWELCASHHPALL